MKKKKNKYDKYETNKKHYLLLIKKHALMFFSIFSKHAVLQVLGMILIDPNTIGKWKYCLYCFPSI